MPIPANAPASARVEMLIPAPLDIVWGVLAEIGEWALWNPRVSGVDLLGPLLPGTLFRWRLGGVPIVSALEEVRPGQCLAWSGRALGVRAVHIWSLTEQDGGVLVSTEESLEGTLARFLAWPLRRMLAASLQQALQALHGECERRVAVLSRTQRLVTG